MLFILMSTEDGQSCFHSWKVGILVQNKNTDYGPDNPNLG